MKFTLVEAVTISISLSVEVLRSVHQSFPDDKTSNLLDLQTFAQSCKIWQQQKMTTTDDDKRRSDDLGLGLLDHLTDWFYILATVWWLCLVEKLWWIEFRITVSIFHQFGCGEVVEYLNKVIFFCNGFRIYYKHFYLIINYK